ncbi:MAG: tetratricopeptide repeat protein [Alphaproteobacteria bacterium]
MSTATAPALDRETTRGFYADEQMAAALAYFRAGRTDKAEGIYKKVAKKNAGHAGAHHMLGVIARQKGKDERAVQLLIKAAKLDPQRPEILCDLGNAFKALGRHKDAIKAHRMVLTLLPNSPEAHSNLGSAFKAAGKAGKAVACFENALKMRPSDLELKFNLGNGLIAAERYDEAEELLRQVVYENPQHMPAQINLGAALKEQGRFDAAIKRYQKAIGASPDSAEAHRNLGLSLLATGQYEAGWAEYEWRSQLPDFAMLRMTRPRWDGDPLNGRTLVVHAEQGFGDCIQFSRYIGQIDNDGGEVLFAVPPRLTSLMQGLEGNARLVPTDDIPSHDVQIPLMSLPRLYRDGLPFEHREGQYLSPLGDKVDRWKDRLGPSAGKRIGIAWQGSKGYADDARRSIPLLNFEPIARLEGVTLVSLQMGDGTEQLTELPWNDRITDFTDEMDQSGAFVDTLAVMKSLDLVVTSDTAVAHLAGAAGIPVWVALNSLPDWRWGRSGDESPWYRTMRLFRQKTAGDWSDVFVRMAAQIGEAG